MRRKHDLLLGDVHGLKIVLAAASEILKLVCENFLALVAVVEMVESGHEYIFGLRIALVAGLEAAGLVHG